MNEKTILIVVVLIIVCFVAWWLMRKSSKTASGNDQDVEILLVTRPLTSGLFDLCGPSEVQLDRNTAALTDAIQAFHCAVLLRDASDSNEENYVRLEILNPGFSAQLSAFVPAVPNADELKQMNKIYPCSANAAPNFLCDNLPFTRVCAEPEKYGGIKGASQKACKDAHLVNCGDANLTFSQPAPPCNQNNVRDLCRNFQQYCASDSALQVQPACSALCCPRNGSGNGACCSCALEKDAVSNVYGNGEYTYTLPLACGQVTSNDKSGCKTKSTCWDQYLKMGTCTRQERDAVVAAFRQAYSTTASPCYCIFQVTQRKEQKIVCYPHTCHTVVQFVMQHVHLSPWNKDTQSLSSWYEFLLRSTAELPITRETVTNVTPPGGVKHLDKTPEGQKILNSFRYLSQQINDIQATLNAIKCTVKKISIWEYLHSAQPVQSLQEWWQAVQDACKEGGTTNLPQLQTQITQLVLYVLLDMQYVLGYTTQEADTLAIFELSTGNVNDVADYPIVKLLQMQ